MSLLNNEKPLHCLYVQPEKPFDEIEEFVKSCEKEYHIKIDTIKGNIKNVLEKVCDENPALKACIMGSRRTDPYCANLKSFHVSPTVFCLINFFFKKKMFTFSQLIQDGPN